MNFRMIQAVIKCFERSTVERIKEDPIRTCPAAYLYDVNTAIGPNSVEDAHQDICKDKECNLGPVAGY